MQPQAIRKVSSYTTEDNSFSIDANGKAFKVLMDGIYADKITSITRELWANALDSHIDNGNPEVPFEVSFPTAFDPTFRVRDFGTGLSHELVMRLYTTMFRSTKEGDKRATGRLGLGSKSPFAYTDSFNVVAIQDGEKRFYSAMIGEDDVPRIHLMGAEPTEEPNGLEVSFAVDPADLKKFQTAAKRVSLGFEVKPIITTADAAQIDWPERATVSFENGDVTFFFSSFAHITSPHAHMGCVLYEIDIEQLPDLSPVAKIMARSPCIIRCEMDTVAHTSSREALSYGRFEPTIATLTNALNRAAGEMISAIEESIEAAPTLWEALCVREQRLSKIVDYDLTTRLRDTLKWRGTRMPAWLSFDAGELRGIGANHFETGGRTRVAWRNEAAYISLTPGDKPVIYIEDRTQPVRPHVSSKVQAHWEESQKAEDAAKRPRKIVWLRYLGGNGAAEDLMALLDMLEGIPIVYTSDLTEKKVATSAPIRAGKARILKMHITGETKFYYPGEFTPEDMEQGGYWLPLEFGVPHQSCPGDLVTLRQTMTNLGDFPALPSTLSDKLKTPDVVYGVPKSRWGEFDDHPQWQNFWDVGEAWLKAQLKAHRKALAQRAALRGRTSRTVPRILLSMGLLESKQTGSLPEGSLIPALKKLMKMDAQLFDRGDEALFLLTLEEIAASFVEGELLPTDEAFTAEVADVFTRADERYNLLTDVPQYLARQVDGCKRLWHYIRVCDTAALSESQ